MMKRALGVMAVLTLLLGGAGQVMAANVVSMDFVGLQNLEPIGNYYNGGTGGFGSGPGPNYGITFGPDSLAIISYLDGGSGNFSNAPSSTIAFFLSGSGDVMDKASGFTTGFSFYYAAAFAGSVNVYSGLDGTGSLLASLSLPATPSPYSVWVPIGVSFSGTAESAVFAGAANYIGFDDITVGSASPNAAPEPSSLTLFGLGSLGLLGHGWRRRNRAAA